VNVLVLKPDGRGNDSLAQAKLMSGYESAPIRGLSLGNDDGAKIVIHEWLEPLYSNTHLSLCNVVNN
jgi:hypothetical protein